MYSYIKTSELSEVNHQNFTISSFEWFINQITFLCIVVKFLWQTSRGLWFSWKY